VSVFLGISVVLKRLQPGVISGCLDELHLHAGNAVFPENSDDGSIKVKDRIFA
jgi:hypothetical protein